MGREPLCRSGFLRSLVAIQFEHRLDRSGEGGVTGPAVDEAGAAVKVAGCGDEAGTMLGLVEEGGKGGKGGKPLLKGLPGFGDVIEERSHRSRGVRFPGREAGKLVGCRGGG